MHAKANTKPQDNSIQILLHNPLVSPRNFPTLSLRFIGQLEVVGPRLLHTTSPSPGAHSLPMGDADDDAPQAPRVLYTDKNEKGMVASKFYEAQQLKIAASLQDDAARLGRDIAEALRGGGQRPDESANEQHRRALEAEREARLAAARARHVAAAKVPIDSGSEGSRGRRRRRSRSPRRRPRERSRASRSRSPRRRHSSRSRSPRRHRDRDRDRDRRHERRRSGSRERHRSGSRERRRSGSRERHRSGSSERRRSGSRERHRSGSRERRRSGSRERQRRDRSRSPRR